MKRVRRCHRGFNVYPFQIAWFSRHSWGLGSKPDIFGAYRWRIRIGPIHIARFSERSLENNA